jgi:hypothetical protein
VDEEPDTRELRISQGERETLERRRAREADTEEAVEQHERRADKAAYLRQKLEERAESERRAADEGP